MTFIIIAETLTYLTIYPTFDSSTGNYMLQTYDYSYTPSGAFTELKDQL